jgi:hypothetical protein
MKLCSQCHHTPWPYLVAVFIAAFAAFLTWLILGYNAEFSAHECLLGSIGMFLVVGAALSHYMMSCMKRHCRHNTPNRNSAQGLGSRPRPLGT